MPVKIFNFRPGVALDQAIFLVDVYIEAGNLNRWLGGISKKSSTSLREECKKWLVGEMRKEGKPVRTTKAKWKELALEKFSGLSQREFNRVWVDVDIELPGLKIGAPGRKKSK
jgi:hypothetical protein